MKAYYLENNNINGQRILPQKEKKKERNIYYIQSFWGNTV